MDSRRAAAPTHRPHLPNNNFLKTIQVKSPSQPIQTASPPLTGASRVRSLRSPLRALDPPSAPAPRLPCHEGAHSAPSRHVRPPQTPHTESRRGRKAVTIYLDTAAHRQLRLLALEADRPVQTLMTEATNDLFQKHGKARIAE